MSRSSMPAQGNPYKKKEQFFERFLNKIMAINNLSSFFRKVFLFLSLFATWFALAVLFYNLEGQTSLPIDLEFLQNRPLLLLLVDYARILFSFNTIIMMLLIFCAYRLALSLSGYFFAQIFKLSLTAAIPRDLARSAFSAGNTDLMEVKNGELIFAGNQKMLRGIGGPVRLKISAGNAIILEKKEGDLVISAPHFDAILDLDGFERIRNILDLRDYATSINIASRTVDGIPILIRGMKILLSPSFRSGLALDTPIKEVLDPIYWLTYASGNVPWQIFIIEEITREFTIFLQHYYLQDFFVSDQIGSPSINEMSNGRSILEKMPVNRIHAPHTHQTGFYRMQPTKKWKPVNLHECMEHRQRIPLNNNYCSHSYKGKFSLPREILNKFGTYLLKKFEPFQISVDWTDFGEFRVPPRYLRNDYLQFVQNKKRYQNLQNADFSSDFVQHRKSIILEQKVKQFTNSFYSGNDIIETRGSEQNEYHFRDFQIALGKGAKASMQIYRRVPKRIELACKILVPNDDII